MKETKITRRSMLGSSLAAGAVLGGASRAFAQKKAPKNVLLLISDDHGRGDLPCYGNQAIKTPHLEQLAKEGVRFTNAFCTTPSCTASRSVILTGLQNHRNGLYGHMHSYNHFMAMNFVKSLPHILQTNGYKTGVVGKLHVAPADIFPWDYQPSVNSRNVTAMAAAARTFFDENVETPFYLHVGFSDPHRSGRGFGNEKNKSDIEPVVYSPDEVNVPDFLPDTPTVREELAEYYQAVSRMDKGVGLILEHLKETGKDKDTLVIYISDNGIAFPGAKTCLYDWGINLPMIVRKPGLKKPGLVNHAMVSYVDLTPTILDWCEVKPPEKYAFHGKSFLPVLEDKEPQGWDEIYFSHTFHEITMYYPSRGVRTKRYKYINNLAHPLPFPFASDLYRAPTWQEVIETDAKMYGPRTVEAYMHRPEEELYDIVDDPNEVNNLAGEEEHQEVLKDLRRRTLEFRQRTKDPWLILNNYIDPSED